ncbi:tetratricopeptide repeat protein [Bradyrhizobium sp. 157]|nr:tetratricopeptide repeat protein [Bradyrhizobium sp. 157]
MAPDLFDRDPVLHRLCELVRRARPPAGLGRRDRHHGGAGDRRRGVGGCARRAARPDPDRGAGVYAGGRGAGDTVLASKHFKAGDLEGAARRYREILAQFPDDGVAKLMLATCLPGAGAAEELRRLRRHDRRKKSGLGVCLT